MKIKAKAKVKNAVVSLKAGETENVQRRVGEQMVKNGEATEVKVTMTEYLKERNSKKVRVVIQEREEKA